MTEEELARLEALAAAATPGPWTERLDETRPDWRRVYGEGRDIAYMPPWATTVEPDAAFIAAARTAVPKLVAEVRRLREFTACQKCGGRILQKSVTCFPCHAAEHEAPATGATEAQAPEVSR